MDEYIIFFLGLLIGFWLGRVVTSAITAVTFKEILKDLGVTERQLRELKDRVDREDQPDTKLQVLEIKLEQIGSTIYAYRKDNDQFLGQGDDREALIKRLTENLTNVRVIIAKEDGADLLKNG